MVPLPEAHKAARVVFSNWLLNQPDWFEEKVIWSDEKWFVLKQKPNKQNQCYWVCGFNRMEQVSIP